MSALLLFLAITLQCGIAPLSWDDCRASPTEVGMFPASDHDRGNTVEAP